MIQRKASSHRPLVLLFLMALVVFGCNRRAAERSPAPAVPGASPSPGLTGAVPVRPVQTKTATPLVPTATVILTPSPVPATPTVQPSWTPLPTLPPEQAQALIRELNETNGGCRLPCWWGVTPGETNWNEAQQFFTAFATEINYRGYTRYGIDVSYELEGYPAGFRVWVNNEKIVRRIYIGPGTTQPNFQLTQLLHNYGAPEQIYIRALPNVPSLDIPFSLALFYGEDRILARYELLAKNMNGMLITCPKEAGPAITLWSEEEEWTEDKIQDEVLGGDPVTPLRRLEDVTIYSLESFVTIFSQAENENCIVTPEEHWRLGLE